MHCQCIHKSFNTKFCIQEFYLTANQRCVCGWGVGGGIKHQFEYKLNLSQTLKNNIPSEYFNKTHGLKGKDTEWSGVDTV